MTDPAPDRPLLAVDDLHVHFGGKSSGIRGRSATVRAVDGVSFRVDRGTTLCIVGESGCGKSTTGRAIVALEKPTKGRILFDNIDINALAPAELRRLRPRFQMVFQDAFSSLDPRQRAFDIVTEALRVQGVARATREERVSELLGLVGLPEGSATRRPNQFSGGQRQRIGIARALAAGPELIVCDEPVSALDVSMQAQIVNLLRDLQERLALTYVFISHDLAVVRNLADRVAVMYLGRIVELADGDALFGEIPRHPYTVVLLSSVALDPSLPRRGTPIPASGEPPSPVSPPSGCHFHPRCWLRERLGNPEICETTDPSLDGIVSGAACHFSDQLTTSLSVSEAEYLGS